MYEHVRLTKQSWLILFAVGVALGLLSLDARFVFVFAAVCLFGGWLWLVDRSYVDSLAVILALIPVWEYVRLLDLFIIRIPDPVSALTVFKNICLLIFFLHWIVVRVRSVDSKIRFPKTIASYLLIITILLFWSTVTKQLSPVRVIYLFRPYMEMLVFVGVPLLALNLSNQDISRLLDSLLVAGSITVVIALYHYYIDPTFLLRSEMIIPSMVKTSPSGSISAFLGPRLQSFTGNPNDLANMMLVTSVLAFGTMLDNQRQQYYRWLSGVLVVLAAFVLVLTRSRDDIGMFVVAISLFVLYSRQTIALVGGVGFLGGIMVNFGMIRGIFERLLTQGNPRVGRWQSAIDHFGLELLFGTGVLQNAWVQSTSIDSAYLRLLIVSGGVSLGAFLLFNGYLLVNLFRNAFQRTAGSMRGFTIAAAIITLLGVFTFRVGLFVFPFTLYYWLLVALGYQTLRTDGLAPLSNVPR